MGNSKLNEIYEGWKNLIFPSIDIENMAKNRALICSECDKNKLNTCVECGCWISAKVRSKESRCPLSKW